MVSGTLVLPQGRMLEYVHVGFESICERELILYFEKGRACPGAAGE